MILFATVPIGALYGFTLALLGSSLLLGDYKSQIRNRGLKSFLPIYVNDLLLSTDLFDTFLDRLRQNAFASKILRLLGMIQTSTYC